MIFGLSFDNKSPRFVPPSETEQFRQVCGFSSLGNIYGVNGFGLGDAANLPFGFLAHQDIRAWGYHSLNSYKNDI